VFKGIDSVSDVRKCVELGASGVVLSHHMNMFPYSVPPLQVLPDAVKAASGRLLVFLDSNVCSGVDAFKALALGAKGVGVGRQLWRALAESREAAEGLLLHMTEELKGAMARTCTPDLDHMDPSVIIHKKT